MNREKLIQIMRKNLELNKYLFKKGTRRFNL
jgi:hypothetical protein